VRINTEKSLQLARYVKRKFGTWKAVRNASRVENGVYAVPAEFEVMEPDEDGWSEWIHPLPGYLMQCCDCGLVHELEVAIVPAHEAISPTSEGEDAEHVIIFRMRRPV
jgi:hypothetical protein